MKNEDDLKPTSTDDLWQTTPDFTVMNPDQLLRPVLESEVSWKLVAKGVDTSMCYKLIDPAHALTNLKQWPWENIYNILKSEE